MKCFTKYHDFFRALFYLFLPLKYPVFRAELELSPAHKIEINKSTEKGKSIESPRTTFLSIAPSIVEMRKNSNLFSQSTPPDRANE